MNEEVVSDLFYDILGLEPAAEFCVGGVPGGIGSLDQEGILEILLADVADIAVHVHDLVIAQDKVDIAFCLDGFLFEVVDQPQALCDM